MPGGPGIEAVNPAFPPATAARFADAAVASTHAGLVSASTAQASATLLPGGY